MLRVESAGGTANSVDVRDTVTASAIFAHPSGARCARRGLHAERRGEALAGGGMLFSETADGECAGTDMKFFKISAEPFQVGSAAYQAGKRGNAQFGCAFTGASMHGKQSKRGDGG